MSQPRPCSHPEAASTSQETRGRYEYRPRDPADSVIVQILEKHLERFFAATESEDGLRGSVKTPIGVRRQFSSIHLLSLLEGL